MNAGSGERLDLLHLPVMVKEVINGLSPKNGGHYLDGTAGLGGHAAAILEAAPECEICALDRDSKALELARKRLAHFAPRIHFFHMEFGNFPVALETLGWEKIDGALLDLGLSSLQLDDENRGFSFRLDGPLDMRMNHRALGQTAEMLVNSATFDELREIIAMYGEDPQAGRIARAIMDARQQSPIRSTSQLAEIVWHAYPALWRRSARRHPATRVFQALRMVVNEEQEQLREFLDKIWSWLAPGGRLAIISFHSIEDRMVKRAMKQWALGNDTICPGTILHKKPLTPVEEELAANSRSRSAKLRIIEKSGFCSDFA